MLPQIQERGLQVGKTVFGQVPQKTGCQPFMVDIQNSLQGQSMKSSRNVLLTPLGLGLGYFEIALKRPFEQHGIVKMLNGQGKEEIHGGLQGAHP